MMAFAMRVRVFQLMGMMRIHITYHLSALSWHAMEAIVVAFVEVLAV